MSLPISVEFIKKTKECVNKLGKTIYRSEKNKNEIFRDMVNISNQNIHFKYVLADIWFSSSQNMNCIKKECKKDFILAIKENRNLHYQKWIKKMESM